ncbi:hypothetical protein [Streptomyces sp. bgisy100]|uniref:hypothetical protein n=1 Tax=Streptomyces sp. bgisy100 TaxID=3413783 RepID=UPI003D743453
MTQGEVYVFVILLSIVVVMLVRSGEIRAWQMIVLGLWGFYLAMTPLANFIAWAVNELSDPFT